MSAAELLVAVIIVTVVVTFVVLAAARIGNRLGTGKQLEAEKTGTRGESWYFVRFYPPRRPESDE